jgi:threonine/homoserine/homoserine lactone efflux protein
MLRPVNAFLVGLAAGYGVAIPVGAIAVLIVRTGVGRGFRIAAAAGAGAATADLVYALAAVLAGAVLVDAIAPILTPVRLTAAALLVGLAARTVIGRDAGPRAPGSTGADPATRTYALFVGLTLLNPTTVAYFVSLAIGLPEIAQDVGARLSFAMGAAVASLSWQTLLAGIGAILHARLDARMMRATSIVSAVILLAFALRIAADALSI